MIRSPLRYPGGKSRLVKKIRELVPDFDEFREPFVGGASVFFDLKQAHPDKKFWISDKYDELAAFWMQSQADLDGVIDRVEDWKRDFSDGKKLFYFLKENKGAFNKTEIAAMFFVFNRITFSGTTEAGGYSEQAFEGRFTESSIERLRKIGNILQDTKITKCDYEEVISAKGSEVFLFLDPPYSKNRKSALYGKNGELHKGFDHERLADTLRNCPHKWLLTYDDSEHIQELYSFANVAVWDMTYGMRNVTKGSHQNEKELFISNYSYDFAQQKQLELTF